MIGMVLTINSTCSFSFSAPADCEITDGPTTAVRNLITLFQ